MGRSQNTAIVTSAGNAQTYPTGRTASKVSTQAPLIATQSIQQILGSSTDAKDVVLPALTANVAQDVAFTIALSGFPSPFVIDRGTGLIQTSVHLISLPKNASTIVGVPAVSLFFGTVQRTSGSPIWSLAGGRSYQGATLAVKVRVLSIVDTVSETVSFLAHSLLLASPVS